MRVLHLGRFASGNSGGIPRHVSTLLPALHEEIEVENLVASAGLVSDTDPSAGYPAHRVASLGTLAGVALSPLLPWRARSLHRSNPYDIVHLHFPDPLSHLAFECLQPRPKLVITWHSDIIRQRFLLRLYQPWLDRIVARADAIIAPTPLHFSSSTQLQAASAGQLHVVPFGLDYAPFDNPQAQAAGARLRGSYSCGTLLFALGRHVGYKGFAYLIRALADLEDVCLILGGSGPLTGELRELARAMNLQTRVSFVGHIADEDLPAYYHAADIFCLPSVSANEAFGLVQLEAMACGKPVISCELHNGVTWVNRHEETGLVVPPADAAALAQAIRRLARDGALRCRLGEYARRRVHEKFSITAMKDGTLAVYRSLMQDKI